VQLFLIVDVAIDREVEGDLFLQDIGQGVGYRPGIIGLIQVHLTELFQSLFFNGYAMPVH
jgi:hypothetical protein